jgi:hypothetical protein
MKEFDNIIRGISNRHRTPEITHLSIHRTDRGPARDWRDFQAIKNQLVGPECEGVELYPAEERLVDSASEFHVWVFNDPTFRVPVGFFGKRLVTDDACGGAVQRPRNSR